MATMMFKTTESSGGRCTPQNPGVKLGMQGRVCNYQVTDIPEGVNAAEVARRLTNSITFPAEQAGRWSYKYSELGDGRIIR